jgi:hypothetical protein
MEKCRRAGVSASSTVMSKDERLGWLVNRASRRFRATIMTDVHPARRLITTTSIIVLEHPDSSRIKEFPDSTTVMLLCMSMIAFINGQV